jgi:hypothetical protein
MAQYLLVDFSAAYDVLDYLGNDESMPVLDTEAFMSVLFDTFADRVQDSELINETLEWIFEFDGFAGCTSLSDAKKLNLWQVFYDALLGMQAELAHLNPYGREGAAWRYVCRQGAHDALLQRTS